MRTVRCSSLPLLMRCRAAGETPDLVIRETNAAADLGTEAHRHLAGLLNDGGVDFDKCSSVEVRGLVASGLRFWRELGLEMQPVMSEVTMSATVRGVTVTGTADVVIVGPRMATVLDWKSGRLDTEYREQLRGYSCLVMLDAPNVEHVDSMAAWLRDQDIERHSFDRDDLLAWEGDIERLGEPWDGRYTTGSHCAHCPRAHECPAVNALVRRDATALLGLDLDSLEGGLAAMPPERILDLVRQAKMVGAVADRIRDAVRDHVARSGDVVSADGRLTLAAERRRVVDTAAAWPTLEAMLTDDELPGCVKVSLSRVEEAIAKSAGKGNGARAKRDLAARLEAANAITTTEIQKLVERRS